MLFILTSRIEQWSEVKVRYGVVRESGLLLLSLTFTSGLGNTVSAEQRH